ncbi:hypothetical protein GCM10027020_30460 [Nocardioides salsibiostraticola]
MKPLQAVAMGFVFLVLYARLGGYDLYPDPLGWLLVLYGLSGLPSGMPQRNALWTLGILAALISIPLWTGPVSNALSDADPSLAWASELPRLGFIGLLCWALSAAAREAGDKREATRLQLVVTGATVSAVLPVLVFGAGLSSLTGIAELAALATLVGLIVLCFSYAGREWAGAPPPPTEQSPRS